MTTQEVCDIKTYLAKFTVRPLLNQHRDSDVIYPHIINKLQDSFYNYFFYGVVDELPHQLVYFLQSNDKLPWRFLHFEMSLFSQTFTSIAFCIRKTVEYK